MKRLSFLIALAIFGTAFVQLANAETRTVTDAAGRKVEIADTSRIVSIGGAVTEVLYALGLGDRIIAVDTTSTFPEAARQKENVGYMRTLAPEGVLKVSPTLILAMEESGPKDAIEILERASVPFVLVPEAKDAEGVARKIRFIAEAVGVPAEGEKFASAVLGDFSALSRALSGVKQHRKAAFILSMGGGAPIVGGIGTPADAMFKLADVDNALASVNGFKPANEESLIVAAPDAVVVMSERGHSMNPEVLFAMPALANSPAARTRNMIGLPGLYLLGFGPRTAHAARDLAAALYPEANIPALPARPWTSGEAEGAVTAAASVVRDAPFRRGTAGLWVCAALLIAAMIGSLAIGPVSIAPGHVISILFDAVFGARPSGGNALRDAIIVLDIRLPRMFLGVFVGASLAVAGVLLQGIFRNPLADPIFVGVSPGAALAAVTFIVLGGGLVIGAQDIMGRFGLILSAFFGALVTTAVLHRLTVREGRTSVAALLFTGIALGALASAGTGVLLFMATDQQLREFTFWSFGSLGGATWIKVAMLVPFSAISFAIAAILARGLDAVALGEAEAFHLGINVERLKRLAIVAVAAGAGGSVAVSGTIGFIGLVVPHLLRLMIGPSHKKLLIGSALLGAAILVAADVIARTVASPAELPIGVVTAFLGAPFFLWLLRRYRDSLGGLRCTKPAPSVFSRRGRAIMNGVDFSVAPGKIVAIVGPNGAGKSTLLKLLSGEIAPTGGEIRLDGRPLGDWPAHALARRRAVLPQSASVSFPFTVAEIVALGALGRPDAGGTGNPGRKGAEVGGASEFRGAVYDELSGGERQRVQLARVFAQLWSGGENGYLLLDEPTSNLDLSHQLLTLELARKHAEAGAGVICVLHDLNLASMAADEIVALKDGRVVASGAPRRDRDRRSHGRALRRELHCRRCAERPVRFAAVGAARNSARALNLLHRRELTRTRIDRNVALDAIKTSQGTLMDFSISERQRHWRDRVVAFIAKHVHPVLSRYDEEIKAFGENRWQVVPVVEELKAKAKKEGLWNLALPPSDRDEGDFHGAGLSNLEYALCAEEMGRIEWVSEVFNCSAPDVGNMEVLHRYGTKAQKEKWLAPLLAGEIRSAFLMTEPEVASSDATNIQTSIRKDGNDYVINGRKWWSDRRGAIRAANSRS